MEMPEPRRWATPFISDSMWLLTTGSETRSSGPQTVMLGVGAAGLSDLEAIGEVAWSGLGQSAELEVQPVCRCEDEALAQWHETLNETAGGDPLPARFALGPLGRSAWQDTAQRLAAASVVMVSTTRAGFSHQRAYSVRDPEPVLRARQDLESALTQNRPDDRQHELAVIAWAVGCFDDLFNMHGWEASAALLDAARAEALEDATYSRISAGAGFSGLPSATW